MNIDIKTGDIVVCWRPSMFWPEYFKAKVISVPSNSICEIEQLSLIWVGHKFFFPRR